MRDKDVAQTPGAVAQHLDPRVLRTRKRVVHAVARLLAERGIAGVTMERVASEAGVARSTLYRYWDGPDALVAEMVDAFVDIPDVPDSGDLRRDLVNLLGGMAEQLQSESTWAQVLPSVIAAARVEPEIRRRADRQASTRVDALRAVLDRATERHQLDTHVDLDVVLDQLIGPLYYRSLVRELDTDRGWVQDHVAAVLHAQSPSLRPA
ncbi:MAG: TetR family transcriptional regulator [Acidimicrobiia bacterium]|nr:TetR family transcriptional regulator [Acidimicrobiia bacterium]